MSVYFTGHGATVHAGDCIEIMATLPADSVDSIVTDPPYGLEFMGKEWDTLGAAPVDKRLVNDPAAVMGNQDSPNGGNAFSRSRIRFGQGANTGKAQQGFHEAWAREAYRVLKPGGHLLSFGGARTSHRMTTGIEDAGFEIRDSVIWLYSSGFPKSHDISKAIDRAAGAEREDLGPKVSVQFREKGINANVQNYRPSADSGYGTTAQFGHGASRESAPATDAAKQWAGWGTALKPAHEPITVARKPLQGTVAANVLTYGTGALNIDGCRVGTDNTTRPATKLTSRGLPGGGYGHPDAQRSLTGESNGSASGRWPPNVTLTHNPDCGETVCAGGCPVALLDMQSGEQKDGIASAKSGGFGGGMFGDETPDNIGSSGYGAGGGASRFFYTPKANTAERIKLTGVTHPTVKPLELMRWLTRLVTPPNGICLDPFAGSGTTAEACLIERFQTIAIEKETDYLPLIVQRINRRRDPAAAIVDTATDPTLFD